MSSKLMNLDHCVLQQLLQFALSSTESRSFHCLAFELYVFTQMVAIHDHLVMDERLLSYSVYFSGASYLMLICSPP